MSQLAGTQCTFKLRASSDFGTHRNTHVNWAEFDLANNSVEFLKPFYNITLQLLTGASACVSKVVVMIDQITAGLSAVIANDDGKIAMVLHLSFKDEYFKLAKWPQAWINKAIDLTCKMYNAWYKPKEPTSIAPKPKRVPAKGLVLLL
ncbi:hypothetical protein PCASD_14158 [Puccinia coronata f. sp. avenae]|uniref:Uncharacterized protein n=1 Tax=Puccinia coronata f. sp. avenae TaxID=200324 RepID=A0A2N5TEJ1_9BASI|nr:hypothetical protein PCASD_14158 [Puccinia coronata f. sp. avenae]